MAPRLFKIGKRQYNPPTPPYRKAHGFQMTEATGQIGAWNKSIRSVPRLQALCRDRGIVRSKRACQSGSFRFR
jgi:hypothetical protein